ncbi:YhcH/YjgK/YiaL family protein [uncultured Acetobacteroides sp.]|uniref:YhcH/YjgK/YiaL family protein n=1 Tax=uncultured Acetobacteroides sp. TaxID=1760811 RepID=UPI0029F56A2E|nr:YhcH/YjgK/YiaL family protein [uncultured Acetobacteroides sp.]
MILDSINQLQCYSAFLPAVEKIVDYINSVDLNNLPSEKVFIDGENLFVIPSVSKGKLAKDAKLEAHNVYADLQLCLSDGETFGWKDRKECQQPIGEYSHEKDIIFFDDQPTTYVSVKQNEFVLFMPWDAHAPLICEGEVTKLIFKIKVG